jgi:hypothetical protein
MLYEITQQDIPKKPSSIPRSRTIQVDLPDRVHAHATELDIIIVMEIGPELISLEATFGNKSLTSIATLQLPGFEMGTPLPGPQEACIQLIEKAWNSKQK